MDECHVICERVTEAGVHSNVGDEMVMLCEYGELGGEPCGCSKV